MKPLKIFAMSVAVGLLVLCAIYSIRQTSRAPRNVSQEAVPSPASLQPNPPVVSSPTAPAPISGKHLALSDFADWADKYLSGAQKDIAAGERFAMNRRAYMVHLIKTQPEQALAEAAPESWRQGMPPSITQLFEQRVDAIGSLDVRIGTDFEEGTFKVEREVLIGEQRYDAYVYGWRNQEMSQSAIPIHGIALTPVLVPSGSTPSAVNRPLLAMHRDPLSLLSTAEAQAAGLNPTEEICGVSGKTAESRRQPVAAHDGRSVRMFCGMDHYQMANAQWLAAEGGDNNGRPLGSGKVAKDNWNQGPKTLLYIRLNFPDNLSDPISEAGAYNAMLGVNAFYVEGSYNTISFVTTVTPLLTLPHPKSYYTDAGPGAVQSDGRRLAREAGFETGKYDRDIVAFTSVPSFDFGGLASVGGKGVWLQSMGVGVTSHELGHNEGLWHANWWDTGKNDSMIGVGTHIEYGNVYDTMGSAGAGANQFNAMHKWRIDWLPESYVHDVRSNGVYRIYPFDAPNRTNGHFFAAHVYKDWQRDYWIEARQKFPSNPWLVYGVSVNWSPWQESSGGTHLIDSTPGTPTEDESREDAAVTVGRTYSDYVNGVYITPVARGGSGVNTWFDLAINSGTFPSNQAPSLQISADQTNAAVGARINFQAIASDPDGDTLAYYWDFGDFTFFTNNTPSSFKRWSSAGEHVVRCVVSDMKGGYMSANVPVTVGIITSTNRVIGRIMDTNGVPIEGVRIHNDGTNTTSYIGGYTDSSGYYVLVDVPNGTTFKPIKYGYTFTPDSFSAFSLPGVMTNDFVANAMTKVNIASVTNIVSEPAGTTDLLLMRIGDTNADLEVQLFLSGSATRGSDYTLSSLVNHTNYYTATIPAGSNSIAIKLQVLNDGSGEGPETVTLTLAELTNNLEYVVTSFGESTVTILDDDSFGTPNVSVSASASLADNSSPESGADNGRFIFTRSGSVANDLTVFYSASGSATPGVDYVALPGVAVIPAGANSVSIEFQTIDDAIVETNETVIVAVSPNAAYNASGSSTTMRIIDDDLVSITIAPTVGGAAEPSATGRFTVERVGDLIPNLVVNYTISGTASNGVDYTTLSGTVTIPSGSPTANITVTPIDDALLEGDESVILTVAASPTYNVGTPGVGTLMIRDDEKAGVSVDATDSEAAEPGSDTGIITLSRGGVTSGDLTVQLAISGTALPGYDYIPLDEFVVIPNGASSVDLMVIPFNDLHKEPAETVIVTVVSNANYSVASTAGATVTIADDDDNGQPAVGFALTTSSAPESRYGGIVVSLSVTSSSPITVDYTVTGGTATGSGTDYSLPAGTLTFDPGQQTKSLPMTINNDTAVESDETVKVVLLNPVGAGHDGNKFHTYTIIDDDKSTITITATAATASESGAVGNFRVSRTGDTTNNQVVFMDVTGTASAPSDYQPIPHSVTIPAGSNFLDIPVIATDDSTLEIPETVVVTLTSATRAKLGASSEATVIIIDNDVDTLSTLTVQASDPIAAEPGTNTGSFIITRSGPTNADVTVFFTISGTANNGTDYTALTNVMTIPAGQTSLVINVTPINDTAVEGPETVVLDLTMRDTYRVGQPGEATVVILDNDQNVRVEASDAYSIEPGPDTGEFTFTRFGVTNTPLTVFFTISGTAVFGVDYVTSATNSIIIPANESEVRLTITPLDDHLIEPTETVVVTLVSNPGYFLGSPTSSTVNIYDNEPTVRLLSTSTNASENGESPGILTIERGGDPLVNLEVFLSFTGTATFGVDYPPFRTNICMPAGVMSAVITIYPTNELVTEGLETVFAQILPSPGLYTILWPSNATVTIEDASTNRFPVAQILSPLSKAIFGTTSNLNLILEASGSDESVSNTNLVFAWEQVSGPTNMFFGDPATNNTTVSFTNQGVYVIRVAVSDGNLRGFDYLTVVVDSTNVFGPDLLYWPFDEGSGAYALDASGMSRTGAVTGASWITNGFAGGALSFNGASNTVAEISGTNFLDGLSALTLAMWVKSSGTSSEQGLFTGDTSGGTNSNFTLWQGEFGSCRGISNLIQATLPTMAGDVRYISSRKFASNQWQHLALVWTNGQPLTLYINGELDSAASQTPGLNGVLTNCPNFTIGRDSRTNYWNGLVDDVRIFSRPLDTGEVRALVAVPPTNFVPAVDAGTNMTVQIVNPVNLEGTITDDGLPNPPALVTNAWEFVSGPGFTTIAEPTNLTSAVSFTNAGAFIFRLIADDGTAKVFDEVTITVTEPTSVSIFASDPDAAELGPEEGQFTISRSGDMTFDIVVQLIVGGIASNGVDYATITNAYVLPANTNDISFKIRPYLDDRTEGDESVTLTIVPQLAYTIANPSATVTIHDSPYGVWTVNHFTLEELTDPTLSGETADFDHDGLGNFLEYAFNREPKVVETNSPLAVAIELNPNDNTNHIVATYQRRIQPTDVQYGMFIANDLTTWYTGSNYTEILQITPDPNGFMETVKEQIRAPYSNRTNQFLTIRVWRTLQP